MTFQSKTPQRSVGNHNTTYDLSLAKSNPPSPSSRSVQEIYDSFNALQISALNALLSATPEESMASVANRARISYQTLSKYMADDDFERVYRAGIKSVFRSRRKAMADALIKGGLEVGNKNQAALQRLYWEMVGDYEPRSGGEGNLVNVGVQVNTGQSEQLDKIVSRLPAYARKFLIYVIEGGNLSAELQLKVLEEVESGVLGAVEREWLTAGGGVSDVSSAERDTTNDSIIEAEFLETEINSDFNEDWRKEISPWPL